jgi:hypothetical protein
VRRALCGEPASLPRGAAPPEPGGSRQGVLASGRQAVVHERLRSEFLIDRQAGARDEAAQ